MPRALFIAHPASRPSRGLLRRRHTRRRPARRAPHCGTRKSLRRNASSARPRLACRLL